MKVAAMWKKFIMPNSIFFMVVGISVAASIDEFEVINYDVKLQSTFGIVDRAGNEHLFNVLLE